MGKFSYYHRIFSYNPLINLIFLKYSDELTKNETKISAENAKRKAIEGSLKTKYSVLSTDEEIFIHGLNKNEQPLALIRRIAGENTSDKKLIDFYSQLISRFEESRAIATITTHYSLAHKGILINSTLIKQKILLRLPPVENWIIGRPLSAFHFVQEFRNFYVNLSREELYRYEESIAKRLNNFIQSSI